MKGLFIVFEGIDCSGKSTQANRLQSYFQSQGSRTILSPEPSSGPVGNLIREIMKGRVVLTKDRQKFDQQMAYLFAADRHDHLYNDIDGVFRLLEQGFKVISTRYYFSSVAYNSHSQAEFDFVYGLNDSFPNPDLLVYLDLPVEIAIARLNRERSSQEVYETREKLTLVSQNYQAILERYNGAILNLDGTESIDSLHQKVVSYLSTNFVQ